MTFCSYSKLFSSNCPYAEPNKYFISCCCNTSIPRILYFTLEFHIQCQFDDGSLGETRILYETKTGENNMIEKARFTKMTEGKLSQFPFPVTTKFTLKMKVLVLN